jgi:hypothetical protein
VRAVSGCRVSGECCTHAAPHCALACTDAAAPKRHTTAVLSRHGHRAGHVWRLLDRVQGIWVACCAALS